MNSRNDFYSVHKNLIVKSIEELHFDEILNIKEESGNKYALEVSNLIKYVFEGRIGPWGHVQIKNDSFYKLIDLQRVEEFTVNSFFQEIQEICNIDDQTLAQYLEEANQTILSDLKINANHSEMNFNQTSFQAFDQNLPGHTKLIMNKGRIGWGRAEVELYAPEFKNTFKVIWVAIKKVFVTIGIDKNLHRDDLLPQGVVEKLQELDIDDSFIIVPIHPWQWAHYIQNQFLESIVRNEIILLGAIGDNYSPQSSIRTLSNMTSPKSYDLKLSVSILNTSCVRGIPSKYIKDGHLISEFVLNLIDKDSYLKSRMDILKEVCAVKFNNKYFDDINDCSYRYKELFGSIWRESVKSKLKEQEIAVPCASLLIKNNSQSYINYLIDSSCLSTREWVRKYINAVVLPLYHMQLTHGLGLVAHGQNTILVLKNFEPHRLIIKDFHGDLRMSTKSPYCKSRELGSLDQLPEHYLIHDLLTGHFVTVLRFLSRLLSDDGLLKETEFYHICFETIKDFNTEYGEVPTHMNLLKSSFEKILVNKVRFEAGYSETNTRLKPSLGSAISNPMCHEFGVGCA